MQILEIMIALALIATLSLLGLSSYQDWREQQALSQGIDLLRDQIELAHTLNITRGESVYLCASLDSQTCAPNWQGSIIVFTSNAPPAVDSILSITPLPPGVQIKKVSHFHKGDYLRFMNTGEMIDNGNIQIYLNQKVRCLNITKTGITHEVNCT